MNPAKCSEQDYINFLVAAQRVFSAVEAARSHPDGERKPAHDAYTRLLQRLPPDSKALWTEVQGCIERDQGLLVIDDTTLDKPYASQMALVTRHWSGKQHEVVQGINLISLVWSDGDAAFPCDFRLYNKAQDGLSKNDHFQAMLETAKARGFAPHLVAFDSWYSSLENLKLVRSFGWDWLTRLKSNRQVSLQAGAQQAVSDLDIPASGLTVHLRGYGLVKLFRTVDPHGNAEHWATSRLSMTDAQRQVLSSRAWLVETYHRSIKQFTGIERAQFRLERSQRNHIGLALRAYIRLEWHRWRSRFSIFDTKLDIIRTAVRFYLAHPQYLLPSTA
ncbi:MAG TPA: transposase [Phototrophicaceae bacterium]|nr:transposase [Phototrophicaceae bacterium]